MDLPENMQALLLKGDGYANSDGDATLDGIAEFLDLAEVPVPAPAPGQALIKVHRAAVNPADVMFIKGLYGQPRRQGTPAGFEGVGTVVAGETPFLGQRVSFFGSVSGTWADYAVADAKMLIPLRPDLRDEDAAGLIVNPMTAMAMFDLVREDGAGSFVATAGGSQLGKFLIGLGAEAGITPIAVVRRSAQTPALEAMGSVLLASDQPDFTARAGKAIEDHAPRILLDAVGDQIAADLFFAMPRGARWVSYGRLSQQAPALTQMGQFIFMKKRIEGFWLSSWLRGTAPDRVAAVVQEVQARFADGRWHTDISATVSLADALEQLPGEYAKKNAKVLLAP